MSSLRLPDFIIAGAPRSGTTWLYHLLDSHPDIALAKPVRPEPKFFLVDELYKRGLAYYSERWFASIPADKVAGEKSTNYLESPAVAQRIYRELPQAKLIFILRNPVERAYSNYQWSRMNGMEPEDFATALALEPERDRQTAPECRYSRPHAYFARGLYAEHLERYWSIFPNEQLLVLLFEDCIHRPADVATCVHRFLAVTPRPDDARRELERNQASAGRVMPADIRAILAARYAEPNRRLAKLLGWSSVPWAP